MDAMVDILNFHYGNVTETLSLSQAANIWEENAVKIFSVVFN